MPKSELIMAIEQVCDEKNIPFDSVVSAIEAALAVAYRKEFGNKLLNCRVEFNPEDGSSRIFDVKTVVEDPTEEEKEAAEFTKQESVTLKPEKPKVTETAEEQKTAAPQEDQPKEGKTEGGEPAGGEGEEEHRFNPRTEVGITEAKTVKPDAELGDEIIRELPVPEGYGRVAAQTAKQVIIQKLREAERETLYQQYKDRVGEIVNATVQRVEGPMVFMDLGHATALMPPGQQVPRERYKMGDRYKVYLLSVEQGRRGPEIVASRTTPEMVKALFTMEVPELGTGSIEIKAVAREAGSRSKIAVTSLVENIDPIGSCVGQRGARVQTVINELGGEKIDIIEYSDDPVKFIVNALSPAKVLSVRLNEEQKLAQAFVREDQLSLAIGKGGQNVRLAAKLSGWKIDVLKETTATPEESDSEAEQQPSASPPPDTPEELEEQKASPAEPKT